MKCSNFYTRLHGVMSQIIVLFIKRNACLVILFLINRGYLRKHVNVKIKTAA
jgi:hypothetical protein